MIQLIPVGLEIGIKQGNRFVFYKKNDISVLSTSGSEIVIKNKGIDILRKNTIDFLTPKNASVKGLIFEIKQLLK